MYVAENEDVWDQLVETYCQGVGISEEEKRQCLSQTPDSLYWRHAVKYSIAELKSQIVNTLSKATDDAMKMLKIVEREEELMREETGELNARSDQNPMDNVEGRLSAKATDSSRSAPDFSSEWSRKRAELGLDSPPAQTKTFDVDVANSNVERTLHV